MPGERCLWAWIGRASDKAKAFVCTGIFPWPPTPAIERSPSLFPSPARPVLPEGRDQPGSLRSGGPRGRRASLPFGAPAALSFAATRHAKVARSSIRGRRANLFIAPLHTARVVLRHDNRH